MSAAAPVTVAASLAALPSVDKLLQHSALQDLQTTHGKAACTQAIRGVLAQLRDRLRGDAAFDRALLTPEAVAQAVHSALAQRFAPQLRTVFNLTGTVLHTNLGRALLPPEAIESVVQAMAAPVNLEYDLATGGRGDRDDLVEALLCELTGAASWSRLAAPFEFPTSWRAPVQSWSKSAPPTARTRATTTALSGSTLPC